MIGIDSQNGQIKAHLQHGKTITPLVAFVKFGCLRLSGRIYDLRKEGLAIHKRLISSGGKTFAEYSLKPFKNGK